MIKKINFKLILAIVLILFVQLCTYTYWGTQKEGLHGDEIYSYGLANSSDYFLLKNLDDGWVNSTVLANRYLTPPNKQSEFNFSTPYVNQTKDVHPPFFYFLLHRACSFSPNDFSVWFGIGVNIIFTLLTNILIFLIAKTISKNNKIALATLILYGFSIIACSMVVFIRMYAVLTFFCNLLTYSVVLLYYNKNHISKRIGFYGVFIATFFGFFTHYYYLVFVACISFVYFIYMLKTNKFIDFIKNIAEYVFVVALGFILNLVVYPSSLEHIFFGYRGEESVSALNNVSSGLSKITKHFNVIGESVLISGTVLLVISVLFLAVFLINKRYKNINSKNNSIFFIILIGNLMFLVLIAIVAPYSTDRYISPTFPTLALTVVFVFNYLINNILNKINFKNLLLPVLSLVIVVNGFIFSDVNYLYQERGNKLNSLENVTPDALFLNFTRTTLSSTFIDLYKFDKSALIEKSDKYTIDDLNSLLSQNDFENGLVVYFFEKDTPENIEYKNTISNLFEVSEEIYKSNYTIIYYQNVK